jgi:hypothetical protein
MDQHTMYGTQVFVLTIEQVAARLQVCDRTIRNRMKRRTDTSRVAKKIGRRWRFAETVFSSDIAIQG